MNQQGRIMVALLYRVGTEMRTLGCAAARQGIISSLLCTMLKAFPRVNHEVET